jgi:hypothetical protein
MKKVLFVTVLALGLLTGCSSGGTEKDSGSSNSASESTAVSSSEATVESSIDTSNLKYFFPDTQDTTELEDLHVSTHEKLDNDNYIEVDILSANFVAGKDVFIYVDGDLINIDSELATGLRTATPVAGESMQAGVHALELAQYADNDDENGEVLLYVRTTYTVE